MTNQMTYGELHSMTSGWQARHITQDLLAMYGREAVVSEYDTKLVAVANYADANNIPLHKVAAAELQAR